MKVIGFAKEYYTLWELETTKVEVNPFQIKENTHYTYIKNLSKNLEIAKSKIKGDYQVDLTLRGDEMSFTVEGDIKGEIPNDVFRFGKYKYQSIEKCEDIDYLAWYYSEDCNEYALKILLKNGFKIIDGILLNRQKAVEAERLKKLDRGHLLIDKERVELKIKQIQGFSFEGYYGTVYIRIYESKCGKEFKYMGSNPPMINNDVFDTVKATIKHDEYNGENETKLLRIKVKK